MRRYDICEVRQKGAYPLALIIQSDFLETLPTRMAIPLAQANAIRPAETLNPEITVKGQKMILMTEHMAGIATSALGKVVANAAKHDYAISRALDLLFKGF